MPLTKATYISVLGCAKLTGSVAGAHMGEFVDAKSLYLGTTSIVVVGSASYLETERLHLSREGLDIVEVHCDSALESGSISPIVNAISDLDLARDATLFLIACRYSREIRLVRAALEHLGRPYDHLAFHVTRYRNPLVLQSLGFLDYSDLDGNRFLISPDARGPIQISIGERGVSKRNTFTVGAVIADSKLSLHAVGSSGEIKVGSGSTFVDASLIVNSSGSIQVGEDCMFSRQVEVNQSDAHHIFDLGTGKRINASRPIVVGNHVWVGRNALLLAGAHLGDGSIVGAASVTSGRFGPNVVVGGSPARLIREGVLWSRDLIKLYDRSHFDECIDRSAIKYLREERRAPWASGVE